MSSYAKAADLLRLAEIAAARHLGVGLLEIEAEFGCDRRTAQRMTKALEQCFPHVETRTDEERRKYWRLAQDPLRRVLSQGIRDFELSAIDMAIRRAERDGATTDMQALGGLRDRLLGAMPRPHARRAETDAEAMMEAQGFASRPGPRVRTDPNVLGCIAEALKAPNRVTVLYRGQRDNAPRARLLEPYGVLLGMRRYLVAREADGDGRLRHFRLDRVTEARLMPETFAREADFDLATHAARAFGSFHDAGEYGDVVWRFAPSAAEVARDFLFHPAQTLEDGPDGSLTVRFRASGWLEMAWHLYQWGDKVEVLEPEGLRALIARHRRADFPALP